MSGGDSKANQQIQDNRNQITSQGRVLDANAQRNADAYQTLAAQRMQQADAAYAPALNGGGGYTDEQKQAILDKGGLEGLRTSDPALQSNFLTDQERSGILGDQGGIRHALGDVNAAVDPASVASFTDRTRLTQAQQDAMATSAARDQSTEAKAAMAHNVEAAQSAGMDPLGVASYAGRTNAQGQINAANAAAAARVQANQIAAQRETGILDANQTLAAQRAQAANTQLNSETGMEGAASARSAGLAANRQGVSQANQATQFNQGQYIEGQNSGRAAGVADTQRADQREGRDYLSHQIDLTTGAGLAQQGLQGNIYGTETSGLNQSTNSQIEADKKPAWWQSLLSAGSQVGAAAAGRHP